MQQAIAVPDVLLVGHLTEAWAVPGADNLAHDSDVRPSEHPARSEVLLMNVLSKDCQALKITELVRKDGLVQFSDSAELRFNNQQDLSFSGRFVRQTPVLN